MHFSKKNYTNGKLVNFLFRKTFWVKVSDPKESKESKPEALKYVVKVHYNSKDPIEEPIEKFIPPFLKKRYFSLRNG